MTILFEYVKLRKMCWLAGLSLIMSWLWCAPVKAQETDAAFDSLYQRYFRLYGEDDRQQFYEASEQMKSYYLERQKMDSFYKIWLNEVLYDTEHGQTYTAIKKSNAMLEDMEQRGEKRFHIVYTALGTIYESRGNYRMAKKYYMDALQNTDAQDKGSLVGIYSRLASLEIVREPEQAWEWNEKFGALVDVSPDYYKVYLTIKADICFFRDDRAEFLKTYDEFNQLLAAHDDLDNYGLSIMKVVKAAFNHQYAEALKLLESDMQDIDDIKKYDFRIKIYTLMGRSDLALEETNKRRELRDSLNSDMLYNNISEVNAELNVAKINEQAAKEREMWMAVVIILLAVIIVVGIAWLLWARRKNKQLSKQNKELEVALDRAEESDRMKTSFIEHVSHEIRTPLNVITGYAQIITNPNYQLDTQERNQMLAAIGKNTSDITDIVNELLEVAQDESRNQYAKEDTINCNQLCRDVLAESEIVNNGRLELRFKTQVADDFTFLSNATGLKRVLQALINNSLKFTEQGFIELSASYDAVRKVLVLAVSDSGIGIPKKYHSHIFHRFFKVDPFKQGVGLGLTMAQKITLLLGGQIDIDSDYKDGCRMVVELPL